LKIFTLYVEDDRYSVPTLFTVEMREDAGAMAHAAELISASQHYLAIEVWDGDRRVGKARRASGQTD